MTDRTQFEAMLEALINEDQETAKEIFHNIVVAKSREIYEELLAEDFDMSEGENPFAGKEEEEEEEEGADEFGSEEDAGEEEEEGGEDEFGADEEGEEEGEDDMFGGEEGEEGLEDRVMDLEDALDELKAEFEQLMAGEEHEEEQNPDIHGGELDGLPGMGDEGDEMGAGDEMEMEGDELQQFMEYVDKVALPKHGDNGVNTRSAVAKPNRMGGTSANMTKSFSTEKGGTEGGLLKPSTQEENFGNVNVPGGNAGKTAFKKKEAGHGAEKKGAGETADNKRSIVGSRK